MCAQLELDEVIAVLQLKALILFLLYSVLLPVGICTISYEIHNHSLSLKYILGQTFNGSPPPPSWCTDAIVLDPAVNQSGYYIFAVSKYYPNGMYRGWILVTDCHKTVVAYRGPFPGRLWGVKMVNSSSCFVLCTKWDTTAGQKGGSLGYVWNMFTDRLDAVELGSAFHDVDYDALSDTWLTAEIFSAKVRCRNAFWRCSTRGKLLNAAYDILRERRRNGTVLWEWNPREYIASYAAQHNMTFVLHDNPYGLYQGPWASIWGDYSHLNSVTLDPVRQIVYTCSRSLDTVFALQRYTGKVLWAVGRLGTVPLTDDDHDFGVLSKPHIFHPAGNDRYYTFDNHYTTAYVNGTWQANMSVNQSRIVLMQRGANGFRPIFRYNGPNRFAGGGWVLLPNHTFLAAFGETPYTIIEGTLNREVTLTGLVRDVFTYYPSRVYDGPVVTTRLSSPQASTLRVCVWDAFLRQRPGLGTLTVTSVDGPCRLKCRSAGTSVVQEVMFKAFWEESCKDVAAPPGDVEVLVANQEGRQTRIHVGRPCICHRTNFPAVARWLFGMAAPAAMLFLLVFNLPYLTICGAGGRQGPTEPGLSQADVELQSCQSLSPK